jgi:hypothetical protein
MLNLATVYEYIRGMRFLLQDKYQPYRYSDDALLAGLNLAMQEGLRVRPDLFIQGYGFELPNYVAVNTDPVPIEVQFKRAFEYGAVAHVLLSDEEDVQDQRANTFEAKFHALLIGERPGPIQGGTPQAQKQDQSGG